MCPPLCRWPDSWRWARLAHCFSGTLAEGVYCREFIFYCVSQHLRYLPVPACLTLTLWVRHPLHLTGGRENLYWPVITSDTSGLSQFLQCSHMIIHPAVSFPRRLDRQVKAKIQGRGNCSRPLFSLSVVSAITQKCIIAGSSQNVRDGTGGVLDSS